ncbi:Thiamine biosynthetic bifunctional enzyme, chloroplastic [Sesamum angolense]|uniref:Thiamine biosynthetic bifunctional enzyme, chloroplastic n=1 Tax=Sesamum angolense TaxID=2727404 RepID=A0AAE2BY23_9LAMI|nr:Thiamine biosynthetic bifunctional enzyme, chloroplastic [Sesamum angolense]
MQQEEELKPSGRVRIPHVLTVAGSDSGAGAGIQADMKACARGGVNIVTEDFVREQLKSVLSDMHPDVSSPLSKPKGVSKLEEALVVDPVMVSTSGDVLAGSSILASFREELLPLADIVTPNLREASAYSVAHHWKQLLICILLRSLYIILALEMIYYPEFAVFRNVLVKGGDLPSSSDAVDVLFDGKEFYEFRSTRVDTSNTHGTGCTLSSSIAAELAKGSSVLSAIKIAKRYVESALDYSKDILIGGGHQDSRMNKKVGRSMRDAVKSAIEGGATIVQLRFALNAFLSIVFLKERGISSHYYILSSNWFQETTEKRMLTPGIFWKQPKHVLEICRSHGVPLLINDRIDIALACDADGVHVGQSDMPARVARTILGPTNHRCICKTHENKPRKHGLMGPITLVVSIQQIQKKTMSLWAWTG